MSFIHNILPNGCLCLAPMDGFTDSPFRKIAKKLGATVVYTEFINALDLVNHNSKAFKKLQFDKVEKPIGIQIFDNDLDRIIKAAKIIEVFQPDFIDINLGCSNRRVAGRGAGAGLLKSPQKIKRLFSTLKNTIKIPVTAKIRLGWDEKNENYLEIVNILENQGCALVAVHGRTQSQNYDSYACWSSIAEIKKSTSIPVIANGDIRTPADIQAVTDLTGCDGVMIGRAALENPWIFQCRYRNDVSNQEVIQIINEHLTYNRAFYGEQTALLRFRKNLKSYLNPYSINKATYLDLFNSKSTSSLMEKIHHIL